MLYTGDISAQKLRYEVFKGNQSIGEITAVKHHHHDSFKIKISSRVTFRVVFEVRINMDYESVWNGDRLESTNFVYTMNEKLKEHNSVQWESGNYVLKTLNKPAKALGLAVLSAPLGNLYFSPPTPSCKKVFSERFTEELALKKLAENLWELTLPDGKKNLYRYENGICQEVTVDHALATISFRLLP